MNFHTWVSQSLVFTILYSFCRKRHVLQFWMEGRMEGWRLNIIMSFVSQFSDPLFSGKCTFGSGVLLLEFIHLYIFLSELTRRKLKNCAFGVRRESIGISKDFPSCDLVLSIYTESCRILTFAKYWRNEVKLWLRTNDPPMTMFWCIFWLLFTGFSTCITLHFMLIIIASMDNTVDLH